jgi:hypothetical protein
MAIDPSDPGGAGRAWGGPLPFRGSHSTPPDLTADATTPTAARVTAPREEVCDRLVVFDEGEVVGVFVRISCVVGWVWVSSV